RPPAHRSGAACSAPTTSTTRRCACTHWRCSTAASDSADARGDFKMKAMLKSIFFLTSAVAALAGCNRSSAPPPLLGTLEWDRIAVPAEVSEPITQILVKEGDVVEAHQLLLTLDPRRTQAQLDAARADEQRQSAALDELRHGARIE